MSKPMFRLKSCPKCRGDLYLGEDIFGKYLNCLQCGLVRDLGKNEVELKRTNRPRLPGSDNRQDK